MAPRWLILSLFLVTTACGHGSSRLAGHWRGVHAEGAPGESEASANGFAGKMQIDVAGDEISVTTSAGKQSVHYKVLSEDKSTTVITTDADGPADPQTFTFVDPKTMRWAVVPGKAVVFTKE
jgi:hypothetical protein